MGTLPHIKGALAVDAFIGAAVALRPDTARDDLLAVGQLAQDSQTGTLPWETGIRAITSTDGLRPSVLALLNNEYSSPLLANIVSRVEVGEQNGKIALTTLEQLDVYLGIVNSKATESGKVTGSGWENVIAEAVVDYAISTAITPVGSWNSDSMNSDNEYVRNKQKKYVDAVNQARYAGVDMALVVRSAEAMKRRNRSNIPIGGIALRDVSSPIDNYKTTRMLRPN